MTTKTDNPVKGLNLFQRINLIRRDAPVIGKDAHVQNYKAVTHDKVTRSVRDLMVQYGVGSTVSLNSSEVIDATTSGGKPVVRYRATYTCALVNIDSPEDRIEVTIEGHADDFGDKAPGKAISYATKNFYLKMFAIETGENDESRVPVEVETLNEDQQADIMALCDEVEFPVDKLVSAYKKESLDEIPAAKYKSIIKGLEGKRAA